MSAVETVQPLDKLSEKQMAERLGTTARALEARRSRGQIPEGVWRKIGTRIWYSVRRYDDWQESLWASPEALNYGATPCVSASTGTANAAQKPSSTPRRKRASQTPPVYAIR